MNKKLGYYSIGPRLFESKIEACLLANKLLHSLKEKIDPLSIIKWYFNDEEFESYNWLQEPQESLDSLYDKRARELREQYDYIIISYSGGPDSHNVVMSFLRQGLFIDELVISNLTKVMNNYALVDVNNKLSKYAHHSEYLLQTLPRLREIATLSPNTKISIFDVTDSVFNSFTKKEDESWVLRVREELNPVDISRYDYLRFTTFRSQLDSGKKIAIILGIDKPRVRYNYIDKSYYLIFVDRLTNVSPMSPFLKDYSNTTIEYFYWHPDAMDLICKQAHTIVNYLKRNSQYKNCFSMYRGLKNERAIVPLIYSTWNKQWFQADKAIRDWFSEYDQWFLDNYCKSFEFSLWKEGLTYIRKHCPDYVLNNDGMIRYYKHYKLYQEQAA